MAVASMLIHGGFVVRPDHRSADEAEYRANAIDGVLTKATAILRGGGLAKDACVLALKLLEDDPVFNAGRGASLTQDGFVELDAMIVDGGTRRFSSVAAVRNFANPILIADALLNGPTSSLVGDGAERFARSIGLEPCSAESMVTARAKAISNESALLGPSEEGTIGAVALDQHGNLVAASSSGGLPNKPPGRISDSCMPGLGAFARNETAALTCTGQSEIITRLTVSRDVVALMEFRQMPFINASEAVGARINRLGGGAGYIGISRLGEMVVFGSSPNMSWAGWNDAGFHLASSYIPHVSTGFGVMNIFSYSSKGE
ncbi:isoaspartyl peptidase/L-asparaginase family protein [Sphingomonas sp. Leaf257]|uniref:isoaspartyl peptidase/L-asparaginase family protein n=1 Tax=Sphingomonas sp. Leaf257 TaxID=1736309 RepID=UPI001443A81F|nr:isoaspartyl peptidase/L-asparaginase [Sphingomonas sp. Leaf257]